jgi:hypothetical protein
LTGAGKEAIQRTRRLRKGDFVGHEVIVNSQETSNKVRNVEPRNWPVDGHQATILIPDVRMIPRAYVGMVVANGKLRLGVDVLLVCISHCGAVPRDSARGSRDAHDGKLRRKREPVEIFRKTFGGRGK